MCLLRDPGLDGSSITLEMLFKAGERKTSTGMTRLLQDKEGKDGRVDIQSQNLGWKKELEEMVLVEMHNSCKGGTQGWRHQSSKQLPPVPVVQTPEKALAVMSEALFF